MSEQNGDDLVAIQVPRRHVMALYRYLAQLDASADVEETAKDWTVEDLRRFAATPMATNVTIGKVLDVLSEQPGEYLSTSQLEERTGVPRNNLKGAFSALTRHIKKHYDGRDWMFAWSWGPQIDPAWPAETHYTVSAEQARTWRDARVTA